MSIKLGSKNIILPYSKAYLGSNLVYQKSGEESEWVLKTGSYIPVLTASDFSGNNAIKDDITITYGNASNVSFSITDPYLIFDHDESTYTYVRHEGSNANEEAWFVIDCGKNIKPIKFQLRVNLSSSNSTFTFLGSKDGNEWDILWTEEKTSEQLSITETYSVNENLQEYKYLKLTWTNPKSETTGGIDIYDLQIVEWYEEE